MAGKNKYKTNSREEFLKYTADKMSDAERNAFEKNLQKDPFEEEAAEGLSSFSGEDIEKDLADLSSRIYKRSNKSQIKIYYRIAASVAVLVVVSLIFYTRIGNKADKKSGPMILSEAPVPDKEVIESKEQKDYEIKIPEQAAVQEIKRETEEVQRRVPEEKAKAGVPETAEPVSGGLKKRSEVADETVVPVLEEQPGIAGGINVMTRAQTAGKDIADKTAYISGSGMRTVSGFVLSAKDTIPLPGVTISIKNKAPETVTGLRGEFSIPFPDNSSQTLIARHPGHKEKEIEISGKPDVMITLEEVSPVGYQAGLNDEFPGKKQTSAVSLEKAVIPVSGYSPPVPADGYSAFKDYIKKNQKYPTEEKKIHAVIILNFLVDTDGRPDSIMVMKSPGDEFSIEAIRLLKEGPEWKPALRNGKTVIGATQCKIILIPDEK